MGGINACKGYCDKIRIKCKPDGGRYINGQKRCQICNIYTRWEGLWCPCCGYMLRTKPRYSKKTLNVARM